MSEPHGWQLFMPLEAGAHINQYTVISRRIYVHEDRVTVTFAGTNQAQVTLYLPGQQLRRLRDILTGVINEFETERAAPSDPGVTNSAA